MDFKLYNDDCLNVMKTMDENSIDSIVTDPPYGLSFMGKKWDYDVPSVDIWQECLRVLKPGGHLLAFAGTRTQHRMCVNIEDAGFEIRDMLAWIYGCYSSDTEVLTPRGWLKYTELNDEDILQWDHITNNLTWTKPLNKFEYEFDGEMVLFENRHTSQLITKNHSVYAKIRKHSRKPKPENFEKIDAIDIKKTWAIDLPLSGNLETGKSIKNSYLIGWWLTDAWLHSDGKACMFSQSKIKTLNKLRNYFDEIGIKYSEYIKESKNENHKDEHTFYVTGEYAQYLISNFHDRELTWDVITWDKKSRLALFEGMMDGDGSRSQNNKDYNETFWSLKKDRLDIFQALCLSLNKRSHIDYNKGCVQLNFKRNTTQLQSKHKKPLQPYTGKVWCLETNTGAFVVRRNGKAFISGNSGFPKSLNISKGIDKKHGAEREVISELKTNSGGMAHISKTNAEHGFRPNAYNGHSENDDAKNIIQETIPSTDLAKEWEGWGTALKPALEPITFARKPLSEKTIVDNVLKYGTGGINIDGCRIGNEIIKGRKQGNNENTPCPKTKNIGLITADSIGRFPANLIHDGSEEVESIFPDSKSGAMKKGNVYSSKRNIYHDIGSIPRDHGVDSSSGSASRFFYCAKTSKKDRGEGNNHPTVKPTELMRHLVKLITPKGGVCLDPFMGSGSTGKACKIEDIDFIGIDLESDYVDIAKSRIESVKTESKLF